ncbi:MAG: choice-of-anchor M domain-containing protein [Bifidobacteriaceae bacterium]|jgi:putative ABC transporter-associated repeat protein|nr:choice-of-anchor M domain-containing protein [Bifidobacteriaceae bacterium]
MTTPPAPAAVTRRGRRRAWASLAAALAAALAGALPLTWLAAPVAALAADADDPNLDQSLGQLAITSGQRVLEHGHIDLGPKYQDDGAWRLLIHDDVAKADASAVSVWRHPAETVFHVLDQAKLTVPEDDAYAFIGAEPGSDVWVVPQTQNPDVVWIGWNTQDPEVMATIDRGVTLSLTGVRGPGIMTTYLQSGSFGEPQLLWDSRTAEAQPIWVDVNTHTHANWVFTEPGVYLVELVAEADLIDRSHVSDTQMIRFAVGSATSPEAAFAAEGGAATPSAEQPSAGGQSTDGKSAVGQSDGVGSGAAGPVTAGPEPAGVPWTPILIGAITLVAAGLIAAVTVVIVRGNRAKRRVLATRLNHAASPEDQGGDRP